jgi:hypothetical protein
MSPEESNKFNYLELTYIKANDEVLRLKDKKMLKIIEKDVLKTMRKSAWGVLRTTHEEFAQFRYQMESKYRAKAYNEYKKFMAEHPNWPYAEPPRE